MKKLISLLLVLVLVTGCLAGCSGGKEQSEGSKLIGVCMQNKSSSIAVLQEEALIEMFEPLGYDVQVVSADDSAATQRSQVENFILLNAEMLVILPCEISTLEDSLVRAREQGIKVVISGGTGTIREDAYDAVSCDDEFMVGMYVASVAKTWIEGHMDPAGDWEVHFLSSTLSEDSINRCKGEAMILEPYLKNVNGEYVNLMGEVVSEADRVENPVYCEMVASRVGSFEACSTQMSMSDNRGVVSGVLTEHPKVRVFIAYNSLASTAGSVYITDTYDREEAAEFAFFSGGVMGDEYEYLIGSVADDAGTYSCFRGACQFGGGDAAATLANLCSAVLFGEAGVDYGKKNPNSIGLYFPIDGTLNGGVDALVCFDSPSYISAYTYEEVLSHEGLMTYWDSANGYNKNMQQTPPVTEPVDPSQQPSANTYTYEYDGMAGKETAQIILNDDGTCQFSMPGNAMLSDVYAGTYTRQGNVVNIAALTNVDTSSAYTIPGLWGWIDAVTGDSVITVHDDGTFVPGAEEATGHSYTYTFSGMMGEETAQIDLAADGTCRFFLPGNPMITDVYAGTYTREGDVVTITGLTNVDTSSAYTTPGLWDWIVDGNATVTVDDAALTFAPAQ
ncbi:MAG: substrate-binding domain-containing protein [Faecousia sp.]